MKRNKHAGVPLMALGLALLLAAVGITGYNIWDEKRAESSVSAAAQIFELSDDNAAQSEPPVSELGAPETEIPDYILDPGRDMPVRSLDGVDYIGLLEIPSLGLSLPVISEWSYQNLKTAPCRYTGSAYADDLIIAAHNYDSHFGTLKYLQPGDAVSFTDADGNVFRYHVSDIETLATADVDGMQAGEWDLTLFTCTIGGRNRVTVRCELDEG